MIKVNGFARQDETFLVVFKQCDHPPRYNLISSSYLWLKAAISPWGPATLWCAAHQSDAEILPWFMKVPLPYFLHERQATFGGVGYIFQYTLKIEFPYIAPRKSYPMTTRRVWIGATLIVFFSVHVANVVQSLLHHNSSRRLHIFLAITMDNLECRVIRIRTDNRRENWSRMPMNDGLDT